MHKSRALFALIALLHLYLARSAPDSRNPMALGDCQMVVNPTPEQVLHCREVIQGLDNEFHRCCLQRRITNATDNCRSCPLGSSPNGEAETEASQDDTIRKTWGGNCIIHHATKQCIPRRRE